MVHNKRCSGRRVVHDWMMDRAFSLRLIIIMPRCKQQLSGRHAIPQACHSATAAATDAAAPRPHRCLRRPSATGCMG